jgi:hypothetical protein
MKKSLEDTIKWTENVCEQIEETEEDKVIFEREMLLKNLSNIRSLLSCRKAFKTPAHACRILHASFDFDQAFRQRQKIHDNFDHDGKKSSCAEISRAERIFWLKAHKLSEVIGKSDHSFDLSLGRKTVIKKKRHKTMVV